MSKYFLEYRQVIERNVGRTDSDSVKKIVDAFNEAQDMLCTAVDIKSLDSTLTVALEEDISDYSLDDIDLSDLKQIYTITLWDGTRYRPPMDYITRNVWDREIKPFIHTLTGKPYIYTFFNDVLSFAGVPDSSDYTIDIAFNFWPAKVTDDLSVVDLDSFDSALKDLTTALFWLKIEEVDLYDSWMNKANSGINLFRKEAKNVVDFKGKSATRRNVSLGSRGPDYWADPFRSRMP